MCTDIQCPERCKRLSHIPEGIHDQLYKNTINLRVAKSVTNPNVASFYNYPKHNSLTFNLYVHAYFNAIQS
jgi:hypothetical protein